MTKLSGEELAAAYKKWAQDQIEGLNRSRLDIGKFLFGVSVASIGAFLAISKSSANVFDCWDWTSISLFVLSALIGIYIFLPWTVNISDDYDLQTIHSQQVKRLLHCNYLWVLIWICALGISASAIFS